MRRTFRNHSWQWANISQTYNKLFSRANEKRSALARTAKYLTIAKGENLLNSFITVHFNYCCLIWISHSRTLNNKIIRIQERALRIVYNNFKSNFKELLGQDHSFTVHERNIQYLTIEVKNGSPVIMLFNLAKILPMNLEVVIISWWWCPY